MFLALMGSECRDRNTPCPEGPIYENGRGQWLIVRSMMVR